jgi:hypothetical protein
MIVNWKKALATKPGQCVRCGQRIELDTPIVYRKNESENWERAHLVCIPLGEMSQTTMPVEASKTAVSAPLEAKGLSSTASVAESLELAVIALTEISKTLRQIQEGMRK